MKIIYICLLAIVLSACSGPIDMAPQTTDSVSIRLNKITVEMAADGFIPNPVNITAGDTVIFLNNDTANHWPASTNEELLEFDSLGPVKPGESYEFTFSNKGSWKYHDYLNPSKTGVVVAS